jgi:hypothetical protein
MRIRHPNLTINAATCQATGLLTSLCQCRTCVLRRHISSNERSYAMNSRRIINELVSAGLIQSRHGDYATGVLNSAMGAFQGAVDSGYSRSQAAAMAGKLEGSYEATERTSPVGKARAASARAKGTASRRLHRAAAKAHLEAADYQEDRGDDDMARRHRVKAHHHNIQAARATRNARDTCPKCGGDMENGVCQSCGWQDDDDAGDAIADGRFGEDRDNEDTRRDAVGNRRAEARMERIAVRNTRAARMQGLRHNQQRPIPRIQFVNGVAAIGDVLQTRRPSYREIVANQRLDECKSGGNVPAGYSQYDLPASTFQRGRDLMGSGLGYRQDISDTAGMMSGPVSPSGRSGYPGDEGVPDQYDPDAYLPPAAKHVEAGAASGWSGASALGIQLLNPGEIAAVDQERARRLGLDYQPEEEYRLRTARSMDDIRDRESAGDHYYQARGGGGGGPPAFLPLGNNVLVHPTVNYREIVAFQNRNDHRKRRR